MKKISRQHKWILKKLSEGKCLSCGKKRKHYPYQCDKCAIAYRKYQQRERGFKKWQKGKVGRPPRVKEKG